MERISTIQTASVINQPVDATERLTLVEKLEQKASQYLQYQKCAEALHDVCYFGGNVTGLVEAIEVVKQHSDWVGVDERLPDKFWNDDKKYYCRVDTMGCIEFKILVWRYGDWHNLDLSPLGQKGFTIMPRVTHYFELPQSPSEVQE